MPVKSYVVLLSCFCWRETDLVSRNFWEGAGPSIPSECSRDRLHSMGHKQNDRHKVANKPSMTHPCWHETQLFMFTQRPQGLLVRFNKYVDVTGPCLTQGASHAHTTSCNTLTWFELVYKPWKRAGSSSGTARAANLYLLLSSMLTSSLEQEHKPARVLMNHQCNLKTYLKFNSTYLINLINSSYISFSTKYKQSSCCFWETLTLWPKLRHHPLVTINHTLSNILPIYMLQH